MFLKYLIPFDRFVIQSRLSTTAAAQALQAATEPKKYFRLFDRGIKEFEGEITTSGFKINRLIRHRNSFLPVVIGRIEPAPMGSTIHVHMRMIALLYAFCALWLSLVGSAISAILPQVLETRQISNPAELMPVGLLIFFMALVNGGFWTEAIKQKAILQRIFDARP